MPDAASPHGVRLNLGCGLDRRQGYVNVDRVPEHHPDLVCDVTWLAPIGDRTAAEVLAQDVLEHIPRAQCPTALREWNRVLADDGVLALRVPSLEHLLRLLVREDRQDAREQERLIQNIYGTQGYEGDFHFNGFTEASLRSQLDGAGFIVRSLVLRDEWMFDVQAVKKRHAPPDPILRIVGDAEFLDAAYRSVLGREADPDGKAYYLGLLCKGIAREAVLEALRSSDEHRRLIQRLR